MLSVQEKYKGQHTSLVSTGSQPLLRLLHILDGALSAMLHYFSDLSRSRHLTVSLQA